LRGRRQKPQSVGEPPIAGRDADRSELEAAETHLTAINTRRIADEDELRKRREALEADEAASRQRWIKDRNAAEAVPEKARLAYRAQGGEA
jgi:hypothetical protein